MTATQFIREIEAKLNRIDTNAYSDVRPEEILFFAREALKTLSLSLDLGIYSPYTDQQVVDVYLGSITKSQAEQNVTSNKVALSDTVLKLKDLEAYVTIGSEVGWRPTRELDNNKTSRRENNPFMKSYPDTPAYRIINDEITFITDGSFNCTKIRYDYLVMPEDIAEEDTITYPFISELEDKTVTLILENLESRRIQSQPPVSKS